MKRKLIGKGHENRKEDRKGRRSNAEVGKKMKGKQIAKGKEIKENKYEMQIKSEKNEDMVKEKEKK